MTHSATPQASRRLMIALSACALLLALVGIGAALSRTITVATTLATPTEERPELSPSDSVTLTLMLTSAGLEPGSVEFVRARQDLIELADKYVAHPVYAFMHLVPGALILLLAPFQFSSRIRRRYVRFHRWSGRLLLVLLFFSALSAFYLGVVSSQVVPFERPTIAIFTSLFVLAAVRGYLAIRRRDVARHREWMIRMFALSTGIATVRLVSIVLALSVQASTATIGIASMWIGWLFTLAVAETWIRYTRRATAWRLSLNDTLRPIGATHGD